MGPSAEDALLPGRPDVERRQLTVAVLRTYQETCARIIRQFDGQIAQYSGEGMVVYWLSADP